jgi:hypothetical protein
MELVENRLFRFDAGILTHIHLKQTKEKGETFGGYIHARAILSRRELNYH